MRCLILAPSYDCFDVKVFPFGCTTVSSSLHPPYFLFGYFLIFLIVEFDSSDQQFHPLFLHQHDSVHSDGSE